MTAPPAIIMSIIITIGIIMDCADNMLLIALGDKPFISFPLKLVVSFFIIGFRTTIEFTEVLCSSKSLDLSWLMMIGRAHV